MILFTSCVLLWPTGGMPTSLCDLGALMNSINKHWYEIIEMEHGTDVQIYRAKNADVQKTQESSLQWINMLYFLDDYY